MNRSTTMEAMQEEVPIEVESVEPASTRPRASGDNNDTGTDGNDTG